LGIQIAISQTNNPDFSYHYKGRLSLEMGHFYLRRHCMSTPEAVKTAPKKRKPAAKKKTATPPMPTREEIAALAAKYWAERGWHDGHAEQDWLRAEQELLAKAS
jgi:hypothetical protein